MAALHHSVTILNTCRSVESASLTRTDGQGKLASSVVLALLIASVPDAPADRVFSQLRKKPFARLLSRAGTDKTSRPDSSADSLPISSIDLPDDARGPLGLTTLYEP